MYKAGTAVVCMEAIPGFYLYGVYEVVGGTPGVDDDNHLYALKYQGDGDIVHAVGKHLRSVNELLESIKKPTLEVTSWAEGFGVVSSGEYEKLGRELGALVDVKNAQYGDSVNKTGRILEILYPNGVPVSEYRNMMLVTRILDKLNRVANGDQGDESAFSDIAGYGLMGMKKEEKKEEELVNEG